MPEDKQRDWRGELIGRFAAKYSGNQTVKAGDVLDWIMSLPVPAAPTPQPVMPEPVAEVIPHGATVVLCWHSVGSAHNAKPGPLYTPEAITALAEARCAQMEREHGLEVEQLTVEREEYRVRCAQMVEALEKLPRWLCVPVGADAVRLHSVGPASRGPDVFCKVNDVLAALAAARKGQSGANG